MKPPAPRPCLTCPYRRDVPSGIWDREEYEKLRRYDAPTLAQPQKVFLCHQQDRASAAGRVCAGWAGCHDGDHLLALRVAVLEGVMEVDDAQAVVDYGSPVPLFASGAEAADHGLAEIDHPSRQAVEAVAKIERVRTDLLPPKTQRSA
ncbi:UNVERIFIED_ORG: hypothetical protein FHR35_009125 [Microbispora rosea subsp. rosea]